MTDSIERIDLLALLYEIKHQCQGEMKLEGGGPRYDQLFAVAEVMNGLAGWLSAADLSKRVNEVRWREILFGGRRGRGIFSSVLGLGESPAMRFVRDWDNPQDAEYNKL